MPAQDRYAAIATIDRLLEILRSELGDTADSAWPVLSALLRNFLGDRQTTITSLADHSGLPRTSARRLIFSMKAQGWLELRPLSRDSSRAQVVPSARLLQRLDTLTEQTIRLIVASADFQSLDRFDPGPLGPTADIAWPHTADSGFDDNVELTLLAYADPVFEIIKQNRADIERFLGMRLCVTTLPQDAYRAALDTALDEAAQRGTTAPLLVAIPFPWLAEISAGQRLLDLQALQTGSRVSGLDFYDAVWRAGWSNGHLYGIPIQPTVDFLWYRQDLFEAEGLAPPCCFADVIECARRLHRPSRGRAGITWSAAPGLPLGETFLQILGAQGALHIDQGAPVIATEAGRQVVDYLRALLRYSPAQPRSLTWTRSAQIFGRGQAAMCYHWSNRYGVLDSRTLLQKRGRIGMQLHPTLAPGMTPVSPLGGALLAMPAACSGGAQQGAWRALETLTSAELMKYFVMHGTAGNARLSVAQDRYVLQRNRVIGVIDQLAKAEQVEAFPSPADSNYHALAQLLSDHLEVALFGEDKDSGYVLDALQRELHQLYGTAQRVDAYSCNASITRSNSNDLS
ncbi:ABC-type glycerol-3-phosphate transport system, substrate-binding protein [Burkholderia sp. OK233]|nr:ABC-type glycerol-3-phosphate transport system, substrate-binding protein [Burkholderia sp. OK233]